MRPLLQNLALSLGDNEEVCYCLKSWQVSFIISTVLL
jgi:hypothetical protein